MEEEERNLHIDVSDEASEDFKAEVHRLLAEWWQDKGKRDILWAAAGAGSRVLTVVEMTGGQPAEQIKRGPGAQTVLSLFFTDVQDLQDNLAGCLCALADSETYQAIVLLSLARLNYVQEIERTPLGEISGNSNILEAQETVDKAEEFFNLVTTKKSEEEFECARMMEQPTSPNSDLPGFGSNPDRELN